MAWLCCLSWTFCTTSSSNACHNGELHIADVSNMVDGCLLPLQNDDGSLNWGLIVFIVQATACVSVWAGLMATLGYYRLRRQSGDSQGRKQFATSADSHLVTPLMYESVAKGDHSSQLYEDLYQVEDAKLHADDREYVAIQYVPLKSDN